MAGQRAGAPSLAAIRASVMGIGDAECAALYPQCKEQSTTLRNLPRFM